MVKIKRIEQTGLYLKLELFSKERRKKLNTLTILDDHSKRIKKN